MCVRVCSVHIGRIQQTNDLLLSSFHPNLRRRNRGFTSAHTLCVRACAAPPSSHLMSLTMWLICALCAVVLRYATVFIVMRAYEQSQHWDRKSVGCTPLCGAIQLNWRGHREHHNIFTPSLRCALRTKNTLDKKPIRILDKRHCSHKNRFGNALRVLGGACTINPLIWPRCVCALCVCVKFIVCSLLC